MYTNDMRVILGAFSLKAYVAAPKAFRVLGIVRFGMEYGLLATNTRGHYFRVNGSQVELLDGGCVRHAIGIAYGEDAQPVPDLPAVKPVAAPRIVVRKHRHVLQGAAGLASC